VRLYLDPDTAAPLAQPQTLPVTIRRNLRVVGSTSSQATVQETSVERIGPLPPQRLLQRYVISRTSMKDLPDPPAYAYAPSNIADRSPAYSINLPFETASGPYRIWKNEAGRAYRFRQSGPDVPREGLTLTPLAGRIDNPPAQAAYIDQPAALGIPKRLTLAQLTPS
jgi:hypothetical protein